MNQDAPSQIDPSARTGHDLERLLLKGLLLFFIAIAVYIPAMSGGYLYDDDSLLTQNPVITSGTGFSDTSWKGLRTIWYPRGESSVFDYAPLSYSMYWLEWRLWGDNEPGAPPAVQGIGSEGYHAVNILLHAIGALLLWAVLARMRVPGAWVAALIWAVHPVGAESVAWIAERRNVLSTPILLLTLLAWFRFQESRRWRDYALAVLLFALTLLAKSTVVMLPFFLLLWAWWSRKRVTLRDLLETVPFFLLSLAIGLVTSWFQYNRAIGAEEVPIGGLLHRVASAIFALGFYFYKAALPFNLAFNYPEWHKTVWVGWQLLPLFVFAAVFYWIWQNRLTWGRHAILGLGFFVIMIAPALGVMKMAYMRITLVADHFQYMPMMGFIALAVAGAAWLRSRQGSSIVRYGIDTVAAGVVVLFCILTLQRANVFHDPESLWRDTLRGNPDAWQAHEHLGGIMLNRGDLNGALEHFKEGVRIRPYLSEVHNNYGNTLRNLGNLQEGMKENALAVKITPDNYMFRINYASALVRANLLQEAIVQYQQALNLNPANAVVCYDLGVLYFQTGNTDTAIDYLHKALQLMPDFSYAQQELATALQRQQEEQQQRKK